MFKKNWPTIVGAILFIISVIFLIIGGITQEMISGLLVAVFAGVTAVTGIFTLIMSWLKKRQQVIEYVVFLIRKQFLNIMAGPPLMGQFIKKNT